MFTGLGCSQEELLEWKDVTNTLADRAGIHPPLTEGALSQCLGSFPDLLRSEKEAGSIRAASWETCGARLRKDAHTLAASGSHDCTVITKRVCLHQEAAEAFKRSGEPINQPL